MSSDSRATLVQSAIQAFLYAVFRADTASIQKPQYFFRRRAPVHYFLGDSIRCEAPAGYARAGSSFHWFCGFAEVRFAGEALSPNRAPLSGVRVSLESADTVNTFVSSLRFLQFYGGNGRTFNFRIRWLGRVVK